MRAARRARALSWLSLAWMGAEGVIAITAGILAGSIALIGFGIDSAIEGVASLVIVWRFTGHRLLSHLAEERAQKLVAIQFFLLAPWVAFEAIRHLVGGAHPEISLVGMVLTATSLVGMPVLGVAKQRLAETLGSSATHGEGAQNLLCAYLAGAVFLGLVGNAVLGWWWLDPIAAIAIGGVALREGLETWRGEGCCSAAAVRPAAEARADAYCRSEAAARSAGALDSSPIAECRLDLSGLRGQRDRYRALAQHVDRLWRTRGRLEVSFSPAVDEELLSEAIAVERECCPFFGIAYDAAAHRLSIAVADLREDPALDALRYALSPT